MLPVVRAALSDGPTRRPRCSRLPVLIRRWTAAGLRPVRWTGGSVRARLHATCRSAHPAPGVASSSVGGVGSASSRTDDLPRALPRGAQARQSRSPVGRTARPTGGGIASRCKGVDRSSPRCSSLDLVLIRVACGCRWLLIVASVAPVRAGDAGASVTYYVEQVSRDRHDYYAGHSEAPGLWHGAFAEHLGLSGEVAADDFRAVLEGIDPASGESLKPRANRRVAAWDVTFSPPKSISALWALAPDDERRQVRAAQAAAVDAAIGYLTTHACVARLGRDGVDRQDGAQLGFLRADFTHRCSREGDPQLHTHSILANLLQAPDGRRASLDGGLLFQHAKTADGIYQAALRAELTHRLGVTWERRDEQWEIAGIPPGLCREWSKRRSQITAALAERGLDPDTASGRAAQTAALATRHAKVQVGDGQSLHDRFRSRSVTASPCTTASLVRRSPPATIPVRSFRRRFRPACATNRPSRT